MGLRELLSRGTGAGARQATAGDPHAAFLDAVTDDLARGPVNLPCFPDIVPRVRQALDDPKSSADDIVRIAGSEPRLAARLIQTASSVVFNPAGKPAPNLRAAVTRLGHELVQSVAMVFAVQQMKAEPTLRRVAEPLGDLWEKSMAVASICKVLAQQIKVPDDKVFLAGLVHGIGHFYIIVRAAEASSPVAYEALPAELIAARHPAIGRAVLAKWGFEPRVCEAVGDQNDHARQSARAADLTDLLIAGVVLADVLLQDGGDLARTAGVSAFDRMGLDAVALAAVLAHTEHSLDSLREALVS
jgi:HD-like signal output (HDOD) protein